MKENFMDGRNPQDKGDMARHGLKGKSIFALKRIRSSDKASKRKKQLAHWYINMHKEEVQEGKKPGLWDNIHAKRKRIKAGSGEKMRTPGSKGAPTAADFKQASEEVEEGMQQKLRKYVPGYAKRQINKKMDAEKFGRRDVDKDANYWRYKKVQDKLNKTEEVSPATSIGNNSVAMPPGYRSPQVVVDRRRRKDQPPVLLKRFRKYIEDKVK